MPREFLGSFWKAIKAPLLTVALFALTVAGSISAYKFVGQMAYGPEIPAVLSGQRNFENDNLSGIYTARYSVVTNGLITQRKDASDGFQFEIQFKEVSIPITFRYAKVERGKEWDTSRNRPTGIMLTQSDILENKNISGSAKTWVCSGWYYQSEVTVSNPDLWPKNAVLQIWNP